MAKSEGGDGIKIVMEEPNAEKKIFMEKLNRDSKKKSLPVVIKTVRDRASGTSKDFYLIDEKHAAKLFFSRLSFVSKLYKPPYEVPGNNKSMRTPLNAINKSHQETGSEVSIRRNPERLAVILKNKKLLYDILTSAENNFLINSNDSKLPLCANELEKQNLNDKEQNELADSLECLQIEYNSDNSKWSFKSIVNWFTKNCAWR